MSDKKISMLLMQRALHDGYTPEDLQPTMDALINPIITYFKGQTNLAKMYLIAKMLEDQLIHPLKDKIIEGYKLLNSKPPQGENLQ